MTTARIAVTQGAPPASDPFAHLSELGGEGTLLALAPLIALGLGVLTLLVASVTPALARARRGIVLATLAIAWLVSTRIHFVEPGDVLDGSFRADGTSALWNLIFVGSAALAWLFGEASDRSRTQSLATHRWEHDVLVLSSCAGMVLMAGSRDLILFFVGLELLSIPLYALCAFRRERSTSLESGLKYFLLGSFAAAVFLYGSALLYAGTGSLSLDELAELLRDPESTAGLPMIRWGLGLMTSALLFKVSVVPFHFWAPDVYSGSPRSVTALMATGTKAAAFAFLFTFAALLPSEGAWVLASVGLATIVVGNLGALVQRDLPRMLAYSSVAHAGILLLGVAAGVRGGPEALAEATDAGLFFLAAYLFTAAGAFGVASMLEDPDRGTLSLASLRGLAHRRPWVAGTLTLFLISLGGIPLTGGFLGKYLVFSAVYRAGFVIPAALGALLSVIALGYYLRVITAMFMEEPSANPSQLPPGDSVGEAPALVGLALCAAGVLVLGVLPGWALALLG